MKRSLIYAALAVLTGITGYGVFVMNTAHPPNVEEHMPISLPPDTQAPARSEAHLYFSNKEITFLNSEKAVLQYTEDPGQFAKQIVNALIQGPRSGLIRTIPETAALKALYVTSDRTAFVDLSEEISETHPGGCLSEIMTVFSIVNSIILNVPEIDKVKILVGGKEAETLAGHIDLRFPFAANMLLIR